MKLKNKKTGEIGNLLPYGCEDGKMWVWIGNISRPEYRYSSLAELNEEWEDYEEPKEYWYIDTAMVEVTYNTLGNDTEVERFNKEIGNYFETKEEAEKAVEKLKAWKRLKDKEFEFVGCFEANTINFEFVGHPLSYDEAEEAEKDLDLLFGGEE